MKNLNEETKKIKHLFNYKKGAILKEEINSSMDNDYDVAVEFAASVEKWWGGSSNLTNWDKDEYLEYHTFFEKFQGSVDEDEAAATAYKNKAMNDLNREVGVGNNYYNKLKFWIEEIVDEIDDWLQSECWVHLNSKDGRSSSFKVDPEIDV